MSNAERFRALFDGFTRAHGRYKITGEVRARDGKKEGLARTVMGPVPPMAWEQHLAAASDGLGIIPLRDDDTVKFAVIDIDKYDADLVNWAKKMAASPVVLCRSKSSGGHVYIFFKDPLPGSYAFDKMRALSVKLGVTGSEIFPKQIKRVVKEDAGNWINLPYYGNTRTAIHPDGHDMTLDEFLAYVEARLVTEDMLDALKEAPPRIVERAARDDAEYVDAPGEFGDAPPCISMLMNLAKVDPVALDGQRNSFLREVSVYLKKKHGDRPWLNEFLEINKKLPDPLPETELVHMHAGANRPGKEWKYKCKAEPLVSHCRRSICYTRRYGVEPPRARTAGASLSSSGLQIEEVVKTTLVPAVWYMTINQVRMTFKSNKDFLNMALFRGLVLDHCNHLLPTMKEDEFITMMKPILEQATVVVVEDPLSEQSMFEQYLRAFTSQTKQDQDPTLVAGGRSYHHAGRVQFRAKDLTKFLKTEQFDIQRNTVMQILRDKYDAKSYAKELKGNHVTVIDISLEDKRTEDYAVADTEVPF